MSSGKTEIERVHEVLSLMLKNLECPICLDLMKDPVSTKCDHQFCRFCIVKLFKKRNNSAQCPLCNNNITKRSLRESTRFKQLTEGLMKTIHAFELDTGFEFSISNTFTKETENISTYQQLWLEDSNSQSTSTPPKVVASGGYNNRTLKIISTDPPVTESVRSLSPRTKRQKVDAAVVSIETDSDSSDEPLFTANVNAGSAQRPKRVDKQTGKVDPPQDERLMDGNNSKVADENHVGAELDGDSHSRESQTKEEPKTKAPSQWSFCSPEVHSPPKVSPQNLTGHDGGAVAEKGRQVGVANPCSVNSGEEFLDKSALKRGQGEECVPEDLHTPDLALPVKGFVRSEESPSDAQPSARRKGRRSIEKVSEWLSTIDAAEVGGELKPCGQSRELDAATKGGESQVTDENSRSCRSQAITHRSLLSPVGDMSKATRARAEDQVFGKTYMRGARRGSPRVSRSGESDGKGRGDGAPICTQGNQDDIDRDEPRRGKKRKSACPRLGPEDFVRKKESGRDKEHGGGGRESVTDGLPNTQDFAVGPLVGEGAQEVLAEDERGSEKEPCSAKSKRDPNNNSTGDGRRRRRRKVQKTQTPRKQARKGAKRLQLVGQNEMERMELPPAGSPGDENETRIDSFPSSEEPARAERDAGGARRRSGRLKLLDQELIPRGDSRRRSGRSSLTGKPGSHLKTAGVAETRSLRLQEVLAPKSPDTNVNPTPPGEFSSAQRRLNPTDPFKPSEDGQRGCDLPSAGSDRSTPANSGSRASPWLLVDSGDLRDTPCARSECAAVLEPMSPGRVCGQPAVTPGSGGGDRGLAERTPAASQHQAAPETEDSEVDTEALLKTFRSTKRKSFVLQPVDHRAPPASQPQPQPSGDEPAVELKETSDGLEANQERAGNVNESHGEDENERERALVTSEAEVPTFEPNRTSPRRPRAEVDSLEFVPPTFGSPPTPSSLHRRARPSTRSPAANTRSSQRRGSGERAVSGLAEMETLLSARSSQCASVVPATPTGERSQGARRAPPALEKTAAGTELAGSSDQESTLLFSAKSQPIQRGAAGGGTRPKSSGSRTAGEMPDPGVERPRSQHEVGAKDGGSTEDGLDDGSAGRTKAASRANGTKASRAPTPLASPGCSSTPEGLVEESVSEEGGSLPGEAGGGGGGGGGVPAVSRARRVEVLIHREEEKEEEEDTAEPSDWGLEDSGGAELVVGRRKRPVKLSSSSSASDSESSDEELPCFQMLGFVNQSRSSDSKSMSTQSPLIAALAPSKDAPGEIISPNGTTAMENAALEELSSLRNRRLPASQSSEESLDLFSDTEGGCCSPLPSGPRAKQAGGKPAGGTAGPAGKARGNGSGRSSQEAHAERARQRREATDHQPTGKPGLGVSERSGGGQGPGYDSEASHTGDSFSSDSELLTTQQRDAIQTDLKKLKEEMAVLEAALGQDAEQQASQHTALGLSQSPRDNSPAPSEEESAVATVTRAGAGQTPSEAATNLIITKSKHATATIGTETESQPDTSLIFVDRHRAQNECPESPERAASPPPTELPTDGTAAGDRTAESGALDTSQPETTSCRGEGERARVPRTPQQRADRESGAVPADQASPGMVSGQPRPDSKGKDCVSQAAGPVPGCRPQAPDGVGRPEALSEGPEQTRFLLTSSPIFNKSADSATSERPAVTTGRRMSFVASGLSKHEILLVQRFAEKTGGSISSQFLPSTTHVVMKTDTSLVCERTLKYFLGIAGRRWVISYQWILECFKEGRIIEERLLLGGWVWKLARGFALPCKALPGIEPGSLSCEDEFEVRGDVINGRDHQGPRKARLTTNGQMLFTDYEVCCWGSFTGMSKDQLEWLVDLCGASIVKEPYLFTYNPGRVSVVLVQPDANPASADYRAMERRFSAVVVTREWVLDSVACYRCHQLGAYLLGTPR